MIFFGGGGSSSSAARRARFGCVAAVFVVALLTAPSPARAAGGTYLAVQCHDFNRAYDAAQLSRQGGYEADSLCDRPEARLQLRSSGFANGGAAGRITLAAPNGTEIAGFSIAFDGRTADGHYAQVAVIQGGGAVLMHRAGNDPGGYVTVGRDGLGASHLIIELVCANNPPCGQSSAAHAWVRNVVVELRDQVDPSIGAVGGSLLGGGWLRGQQSLSAIAGDVGAGVADFRATVNGTVIAAAGINCNGETLPYTAHFIPCTGNPILDAGANTVAGPFVNGENRVELVATDYAGNRRVSSHVARVDNLPPQAAFENAQDPEDPELIRASVTDAHSGVVGATIYMRPRGADAYEPLETRVEDTEARARVDSLTRPAGEYEFRVELADVAGNTTATTVRRDGTPMRLTFPLRQPVALRGSLSHGGSRGRAVRYGTRSKARGLLLDSGGQPIRGETITVVERFGQGALIRDRVSEATTDEQGRWRTKLPAGPSRTVEASFAGSGRYAPSSRGVGTFAVRGRASFRTSAKHVREGRAIDFSGRVGHRGARIPAGGKLVELQVRLGAGNWDTVGEAFRTDEQGRYRRAYRFGNHYTSDARFRFRVKVGGEGGWPYQRATTKRREVIVRAR